ncbi:MAG TPA: hypothetical protein VNZ23_15710, partial [Xanthobacteraceae bacterium]|nr:hypothetical protein [Xanthobacteraceae bacterium]
MDVTRQASPKTSDLAIFYGLLSLYVGALPDTYSHANSAPDCYPSAKCRHNMTGLSVKAVEAAKPGKARRELPDMYMK